MEAVDAIEGSETGAQDGPAEDAVIERGGGHEGWSCSGGTAARHHPRRSRPRGESVARAAEDAPGAPGGGTETDGGRGSRAFRARRRSGSTGRTGSPPGPRGTRFADRRVLRCATAASRHADPRTCGAVKRRIDGAATAVTRPRPQPAGHRGQRALLPGRRPTVVVFTCNHRPYAPPGTSGCSRRRATTTRSASWPSTPTTPSATRRTPSTR